MTSTRFQMIVERLIADARAAVTELQITEDELHAAAEFLDSLGRAGEFADLLDIFLAVTSVVATLGTPDSTTPNLAGPYYKAGAPMRESGRLYDGELAAGDVPLTVRGRVVNGETGEPIAGAVLDIWQADGQGIYDVEGYHLRGRIPVDEFGWYEYRTVLPEGYQIPAKGPTTTLLRLLGQSNWRPAHIHLRVHVGDTTPLQTQFFIGGANYLDSDPVGAVYDDLVIEHRPSADGVGRVMAFDIRLPAIDQSMARRLGDGPKASVPS